MTRAGAPSGSRPSSALWLRGGVPRRRRGGVAVLGVLLTALGALTGMIVLNGLDHRQRVLVVARTVPVGHRIDDADIAVARIGVDPSLDPLPASTRHDVVGRTAAVELREGMLMTRDAVTDQRVPSGDDVLVGLAVKAGQMPARRLSPGDSVLAVPIPDSEPQTQTAAVSLAGGQGTRAQVFDVGSPDSNGTVVVDVLVRRGQGERLAVVGSAGRVALILLPPGS